MRRTLGVVAALSLMLGVVGVMPASASHCDQSNATTCENPLTIIVIEGIGNVCSAAKLSDPSLKKSCTYNKNDSSWVSKSVSQWNQAGFENGSKYQGLFWPGVGPGADGSYSLKITGVNPPNAICVSNVGGAGCTSDSEGNLIVGDSGLGAFCGSSSSKKGTVKFKAGDNSFNSEGTIGWDQSLATVLPLHGKIYKIRNVAVPTAKQPSLLGFVSARGLSGSGNCGVTGPTTGFQVEGFTIVY